MDNRYCLYHYGVKGMKWNKKKRYKSDGSPIKDAFIKFATGQAPKRDKNYSHLNVMKNAHILNPAYSQKPKNPTKIKLEKAKKLTNYLLASLKKK